LFSNRKITPIGIAPALKKNSATRRAGGTAHAT